MTTDKVVCRFCGEEGQKEVLDRWKNPWFNICQKCVKEKTKIHSEGVKERFLARILKKH